MIPDPEQYVRYRAREPRDRVYRNGTRPAREIAIRAAARRSRPKP